MLTQRSLMTLLLAAAALGGCRAHDPPSESAPTTTTTSSPSWGSRSTPDPATSQAATVAHAGESATQPVASEADGRAVARLSPASGSDVTGTVTFIQEGEGVEVRVQLAHLPPGPHGFHVHVKGDCSAPDAESAGDHFNPTHAAHGARESGVRHVGDLGNVQADADGRVDTTFRDEVIRLSGPHSIVGRSVIVHAGQDDLSSQPVGNSGARIACGVIEPEG